MKKLDISVVVPVYGCIHCLHELCDRIALNIKKMHLDYEIILVNDASPDGSWDKILKLSATDNRIRGVNLSRNFGQHYAITAGLEFAVGDWVVVMDCDLQDKPEEIIKLHNKAQEGFDLVVGRRYQRQDSFMKRLYSKFFYVVFSYLTDVKVDNSIGNFGIYSKKVISNILKFKEQGRSFGLFAIWVGFNRMEINIEHGERVYGKSTYNMTRMLKLALDSIVIHSNKLLTISIQLGLFLSFSSLAYALWLVMKYLFWSVPLEGWTSLIVSIYFTAGLIMGSVGIMGIYVGRAFDEVKARPLYIIESTTFETDDE